MLEKLDKISLYLAIVIIGYLGYVLTSRSAQSAESLGKIPEITKKMLQPVFIEPADNASHVNRDPFDVEWARYFDISELTGNPGEQQELTAGLSHQIFTKKLMGILTSGNSRNAALIDGKVYETGSLIDGDDPQKCWKIEVIRKNEVIVSLNKNRQVLKISENQGANENKEQKIENK
jgi:hypothetical protein